MDKINIVVERDNGTSFNVGFTLEWNELLKGFVCRDDWGNEYNFSLDEISRFGEGSYYKFTPDFYVDDYVDDDIYDVLYSLCDQINEFDLVADTLDKIECLIIENGQDWYLENQELSLNDIEMFYDGLNWEAQ